HVPFHGAGETREIHGGSLMKTLLITGAGGFVGRTLAEHFSTRQGFTVRAFSHKDLDLLDQEGVERAIAETRPDVVLHSPNIGGTRKTAYDAGRSDVVAANLRMFFNVARAMPADCRMLHMGSGAEYDRRHYAPKMSEDYFDRFVPADDYGFSKYVISKHIE